MPSYTDSYNSAFCYVIANEGTTYTDLGADRGGATRYGITLATLRAWRASQGQPQASANDVQNLALDEAQAIYSAMYWRKMGCGNIADRAVATAIFDSAVLTGTGRTGEAVQKVLNTLLGAGLTADGALGPKSLAALNSCPRRDFLCALVAADQSYFLDIIAKDPGQQPFHKTWRRRAADYLGLVLVP